MAMSTNSQPRLGVPLALFLIAVTALLPGCSRLTEPPPGKGEEAALEPAETPSAPAHEPAAAPKLTIDPRLNQTFDDAIRPDPPAEWPRLAETTVTGKSVGKLYTDVVRLWKTITFVTAEGKRVEYSATLQTDLGEIDIALLPEAAPNHVRNFVALARVGYYDGLVFERIVHQESDVQQGVELDLIEGGGPLGAAQPDYDSIGYWLKPEFDKNIKHVEGTVGATRAEEEATAACKFYIIVGKAPESLNGNSTVFGKVTRGLEVARNIHQQPVIIDETDGGYHRPEKPVVIRKVIIHTREADGPGANGENK
jgi:peptidyl-prolyl cis-trans isomerase B (cyclophilin B)